MPAADITQVSDHAQQSPENQEYPSIGVVGKYVLCPRNDRMSILVEVK
jgi:hypothetical protein